MTYNAVEKLSMNVGMGTVNMFPQTWVDEINKPGLKILEVGFGRGDFLRKLNAGPKLYGVECSVYNFNAASDVNAQLNLMDVSTERLQYPDKFFDVVVMLDVLEHVMSPIFVIQEIKRVLKTDGIFILGYPEERLASGIGIEEDQSKRVYAPNFHVFPYPGMFKFEYLTVFLNQLYFKIIRAHTIGMHILVKMINKEEVVNVLDAVNILLNSGFDYYSTVRTEVSNVRKEELK